MSNLVVGSDFAGYRVEALVGRGGMGIIYRGTDLRLDRPVAIKLIAAERATDATFRQRFEREARLTAAIDHPNVIPIYAAGEEDGHLYLVMRYVAGTDLAALLRTNGRLQPERAARITAQVAEALDAAHAAGLVHRDIKPANVLLAGEHIYLSDFGITRAIESGTRVTDSGQWLGTVDFCSPEQLRGERTDARSDVYALGCLLYTALIGSPPHHRETVPATILAHLNDAPPRPSLTEGVPDGFDDVIERAMAKQAAERYPSAGDLGRAAGAAASGRALAGPWRSVARGQAAPNGGVGNAAGSVGNAGGGVSAAAGGFGNAAGGVAAGGFGNAAGGFGNAAGGFGNAAGGVGNAAGGVRAGGVENAAGAVENAAGAVENAAGAKPRRTVGPTQIDWRPQPGPDLPWPRRRVPRAAVLVAVAVALVAAAIFVVLLTRFGPQLPGPLSRSELTGVVRAFATAYGRRDANALAAVLAPDVERVSPSAVQRGRGAVLAEYRGQLTDRAIDRYLVENLRVQQGWVGRASAQYVVSRSGRSPVSGSVVFGVERVRGRPLIGLITTQPLG